MAFGIKFNFNSIIGGITSQLKTIVPINIPNIGSLAKGGLINGITGQIKGQLTTMVNDAVGFNIASKIGSLGSSLAGLSTASVFGLVSTELVNQLKNITSQYTDIFNDINLTDLNITDVVTSQISNIEGKITTELQAGLIVGKSSIETIASVSNISNANIRDFTFNPQKKIDFVNSLSTSQLERINFLTFNATSEFNTFHEETTLLNNTLQPPVSNPFNLSLDSAPIPAPFEVDVLKEYKERLNDVDTNSNIVKKSNINITKRNQKEISTVNNLLKIREQDKPSTLTLDEIKDIPNKGFPGRFLLYKNVNDLRYIDTFGSIDPNEVKFIFFKAGYAMQDNRYPEISGTRYKYQQDLKAAGRIVTASTFKLLEETL
tara:strand:- start:2717 stop:3841 length:1125 start_codon:yes stop_codon:yes gene_type:complete